MVEEEETPSAPRRKEIEISKGVVLMPPERLEEKKETPRPAPPKIQTAAPSVTSATSNLIVSLAILLSVVSLIISFVAISSQNTLKNEIGKIAADLRAFKEEDITLVSPLAANHTVEANVPLREIISPFTIPIVQDVPISIEGTTYHPVYGTIVLHGNATAHFLSGILIDPSNLSDERVASLKYSLLGNGTTTIRFKGADIWTDQLNDILARLELLAK